MAFLRWLMSLLGIKPAPPAPAPVVVPVMPPPAPFPLPAGAWRLALLDLMNADRAKHGCPPLDSSILLDIAAQGQSDTNAANHTDSHDGWEQRIEATGYTFARVAQNVAKGQSTPFAVELAWMSSPDHRANILDPYLKDVGFGRAVGTDGLVYWTANFGQPR